MHDESTGLLSCLDCRKRRTGEEVVGETFVIRGMRSFEASMMERTEENGFD